MILSEGVTFVSNRTYKYSEPRLQLDPKGNIQKRSKASRNLKRCAPHHILKDLSIQFKAEMKYIQTHIVPSHLSHLETTK